MSKDLLLALISKMHIRLNRIIEFYDFDLQNKNVQNYSKRLDKALTHFAKLNERKYVH